MNYDFSHESKTGSNYYPYLHIVQATSLTEFNEHLPQLSLYLAGHVSHVLSDNSCYPKSHSSHTSGPVGHYEQLPVHDKHVPSLNTGPESHCLHIVLSPSQNLHPAGHALHCVKSVLNPNAVLH